MYQREYNSSAKRPIVSRRLCIVMACADMSEADAVGRQLLELNSGCLVTYRTAEDLVHNAPAGRVAMVILATADTVEVIGKTLIWLRRRWPHCPITVVGDQGGGKLEMIARKTAANFLTRPVSPGQWKGLLSHVLTRPQLPKVDYKD